MRRILSILFTFLLCSCQQEPSKLFDDVYQIAEFDRVYEPTLIHSGKESGFLEPLMQFGIFRIDSISFENLENSIVKSERFTEGSYYLNIELDNYLSENNLDILNMSKSSITENHFDKTYHLYLLSDRKTFAICKVNH
ncbi:hypothetical protein [Fulvivirga lutea]|uniref:Lipoprotein n=1 Tax=Fulvivirga lutea TaxID=2810512 RepID=A0A975A0B9_9BACT|nr:hypothetical protein [Fulvivirga lutea]QSE97224.1 hypothetical protein JR347_16780 [Fulvivirga lutea]